MSELRAIPTVPGHPLLGNLLDFRRDRVGFLHRVNQDYGDVVNTRHGLFFDILISADPDFTHGVLVDHESNFVKGYGLSVFLRPMLGNGLLTSEGGFHKRQRKMMAPAFAHKRIAEYATVIAERTAEAADRLRDGTRIDFADEMMHLTLDIVGKTLFDAEVSDVANEVGEAITAGMKHTIAKINSILPIPPNFPTPGNRRAKQNVARLDAVVYRMIRERRASGRDHGDFLSMLLMAQDEDDKTAMTDKQVRDEAMTIFLAGHETTANALAWTFYLLAQHPAIRERLEREVDEALSGRVPTLADLPNLPYALMVFKEAMRLYPPAYVVSRRALADITIEGRAVKKNQLVLVNITGMHHSERHFPEAYRFDPDRFSATREKEQPKYAFLPFGAGPRVCIGNHFALMEGQLAVATLAQRVQLDLMPGSRRIDPEPLVTLRPKGGMPMIVRRRAPSTAAVAAE